MEAQATYKKDYFHNHLYFTRKVFNFFFYTKREVKKKVVLGTVVLLKT